MIDKLFSADHVAHEAGRLHFVKKRKHGHSKTELFFVFSGPETSRELSETIWKTLETAYFETLSQAEGYDRFEEALRIVNAQLAADPLPKDEDFLRTHQILLGLFTDSELHLTALGSAEAYLARKGSLTNIVEGIAPKAIKDDVFVNIASGEIEADDRVLCASERLLRYATSAQLAAMLEGGVTEGAEAVKELIKMADAEVSFALFHAETSSEVLPLADEKIVPQSTQLKMPQDWREGLASMRGFMEEIWTKLRSGDRRYLLGGALGILGLIIIATLIITFSDQSRGAEYDRYKAMLDGARVALGQVEEQEALEEKDRANATLAKAEGDLQEVLQSGLFRSEAAMLLAEAAEARDRINNITRISTPKELAIIKTVKDNTPLTGVFDYGDEWFAFDAKNLSRVVLDKVASTLPFPSGATIKSGFPFTEKKQLVFSDGRNKIFEYDPESKQFVQAKTEDSAWKRHTLLTAYSRFIYLLAPDENQIWKYERQAEGYGAAQAYLSDTYDLSKALSFAIDGNIFVLTSDQKILKFYQGKQEEYEISGAPEGSMEGVTKIATAENLDMLLVLNPTTSTVYVFTKGPKSLTYTHQIVFENIGVLQDIWVKAPKTLVVADETKLYEVPL